MLIKPQPQRRKIRMKPKAPKTPKPVVEKPKPVMPVMPLPELRRARDLSQEQLAKKMSVKQASISKLEKRTDMDISTLKSIIKGMGGDLELIARFPGWAVQISQFDDVEPPIDPDEPPA